MWRGLGAGSLGAFCELFPLIGDEGLWEFRAMLQEPGRWPDATPVQRLLLADLMDSTCRRLVAAGVGDADYFVGCGDMYPDTPDDAAGVSG